MTVFVNGDEDRKEDNIRIPHVILYWNEFESLVLCSLAEDSNTENTAPKSKWLPK
jgi:hypothetical protein